MFKIKQFTTVFGIMFFATVLTAFVIVGGDFQIALSKIGGFSSTVISGGESTIENSSMPGVGSAFSSGGDYVMNGDNFSVATIPTFLKSNLDDVIVFPNPYKPGTGGIFDANALTFRFLTINTKIRIFTIVGELVKTIETENQNGEVKWDVRNESGENLSSGVYLYIITNSDDVSQRAKGKIAVIK